LDTQIEIVFCVNTIIQVANHKTESAECLLVRTLAEQIVVEGRLA
jgi:hypothetical protein